jgi:hypothetical protein
MLIAASCKRPAATPASLCPRAAKGREVTFDLLESAAVLFGVVNMYLSVLENRHAGFPF